MADEKNITIVIKKKKGGHHGGHHGGAWKVAFADFMTAMMAFFLVMWLMGSDAETRESVSAYFQGKNVDRNGINTTGPLRGGDASFRMEGAEGRFEEKDLQAPNSATPVSVEEQDVLRDLADYFEGSAFTRDVQGNEVRYTITPRVQFARGQVSVPTDTENRQLLDKLVNIFRQHDGAVVIEAFADDTQDWALAFGRAVALRRYIEARDVMADKLVPQAGFLKREDGRIVNPDSKDAGSARFILKKIRQ